MTGPARTRYPVFRHPSEAATLGMWIFLATELMFFGPLFFGYWYGRLQAPDAFHAAGRDTDIVLGAANTAILLTSSFFMANAVEALEIGRRSTARAFLFATAALGIAFLAIKGVEYRHDWQRHLYPGHGSALDAGGQLFFLLYFALTGLHALHLTVGIAVVLFFALAMRHDTSALAEPERLAVAGLYWHFVDAVWIFVYPVLYLVGRSG